MDSQLEYMYSWSRCWSADSQIVKEQLDDPGSVVVLLMHLVEHARCDRRLRPRALVLRRRPVRDEAVRCLALHELDESTKSKIGRVEAQHHRREGVVPICTQRISLAGLEHARHRNLALLVPKMT